MFFKILTIKLLFDNNLIVAAKAIGAGCATISVSGSGVGIGIIFAGFMIAFSINPKLENQFFNYALIGFAFTEAIALFGLMIALLILFG